jgi:hypothetical protein
MSWLVAGLSGLYYARFIRPNVRAKKRLTLS